jgi:hypothetical protein
MIDRRVESISLFAGLLIVGILFYIFLNWGDGQLYHPQFLVNRLSAGMSVREALIASGASPDHCTLAPVKSERATGELICFLSRAGVGSLFFPQHSTWLLFTKNKELMAVEANWRYQIDERFISYTLESTSHSN